MVEPIRHVVPERSSASYSADELKAIRSSGPRARLPTEVWEHIISLGIRKRNRSKRAGRRRKCTNRELLHHGRREGDKEMIEIRVVSGETNLILHIETYQL